MKYNLEQLLAIAKKTQEEIVATKKLPFVKVQEDTTPYFKFLKLRNIRPGKDAIWKHYLETWFEVTNGLPPKTRNFNRILKLRIKKSLRTGRYYLVDLNALKPSRYERNKSILKWLLRKAENGKKTQSPKVE